MVHSHKCSHRSPVHLSAAATPFSSIPFFFENEMKETAAADDTKFHMLTRYSHTQARTKHRHGCGSVRGKTRFFAPLHLYPVSMT